MDSMLRDRGGSSLGPASRISNGFVLHLANHGA
jgi:hypothetical protein